MDNHHEFLVDTDPRSGTGLWNPGLAVDDSWVVFGNLENRRMRVESSMDLQHWSLWDVPGNDGLPVSGETRRLPRSPEEDHRFFRFVIEEP